MQATNHKVELAARPVGLPKRTDWKFTESPVPDPAEGELLIQVVYISLDPAMRGWMNAGMTYVEGVAIGEVMRALALGKVVSSRNPKFVPGEYVYGLFGVQEYASSNGTGLTKVDPAAVPLPVYLSVLGMPGMTAYFGILDVAKIKSGDTVVISGAAGAVGAVAGQIAKIKGCRVIGIAGGAEKCQYVKSLGFDAVIDYKSEEIYKALATHCPKGLDVYFDNVGGDILNAALANITLGARIAICGAISQYNNTTPIKGPSNYIMLLVKRATMQGFVVFDFASRYAEAGHEMAGWLASGKLRSREDIVEGLEKFPEALLMLYSGENFGKLILKISNL
jgi:NADPH-dependent curcumin reductase CurA